MINEANKLILIFSFCIFISCSNKKEIQILGYGYQNDNIIVLEQKKILFHFKLKGPRDSNKLCSFNEENLKINDSRVILNFKIDSSGIIVLDTFVTIPRNLKKPFVSFMYPSKKYNFKRKLFLDDENNHDTE